MVWDEKREMNRAKQVVKELWGLGCGTSGFWTTALGRE